MIDRVLYQFEIAGAVATMYIVGPVDQAMIDTLVEATRRLPPSVRSLFVNVDDATQIGETGVRVIHEIKRAWNAARDGTFRVKVGTTTPRASDQVELSA